MIIHHMAKMNKKMDSLSAALPILLISPVGIDLARHVLTIHRLQRGLATTDGATPFSFDGLSQHPSLLAELLNHTAKLAHAAEAVNKGSQISHGFEFCKLPRAVIPDAKTPTRSSLDNIGPTKVSLNVPLVIFNATVSLFEPQFQILKR